MEPLVTLLVIVCVALIILYFIERLGMDAQLAFIARLAVIGVVVIVLVWRFLLPALGI